MAGKRTDTVVPAGGKLLATGDDVAICRPTASA